MWHLPHTDLIPCFWDSAGQPGATQYIAGGGRQNFTILKGVTTAIFIFAVLVLFLPAQLAVGQYKPEELWYAERSAANESEGRPERWPMAGYILKTR